MAATAVPLASEESGESAQANSEDVVLYFGIIDILQVSCWKHTLLSTSLNPGLRVHLAACSYCRYAQAARITSHIWLYAH